MNSTPGDFLSIQGIGKRFGAFEALKGVSLSAAEGKLLCLLGPSGCGKTTLLRVIAGLAVPDCGRVILGGRDVTRVPPHRRGIGMVFQSLALFPHMSVAENIAYGMRVAGMPEAARRARVEELLEMVQMPEAGSRRVSALSGGQRQRVAIARALAVKPSLMLMDEPMSALDAGLREAMQVEIRRLQRRLGVTTVVVTHDQREAMTMADTIAVLHNGEVSQAGAPLDIYRAPANRFVAGFFGRNNLVAGEWRDGLFHFTGGSLRARPAESERREGAVRLAVRCEDLALRPPDAAGENILPGRVTFVRDIGSSVETFIDCGGAEIVHMGVPEGDPLFGDGDRVSVLFPPDKSLIFNEQ